MPDPLFERYKDALKAGHVAALRGRLEEALERYAEAARIADERPLPHTSAGGVLLRLGRIDEAVAAYERALERAPDDPAALTGRAEALLRAGRGDGSAGAGEEPRGVQSDREDGRMPEAGAEGVPVAAPDVPGDEPRAHEIEPARKPEAPDPARHLAAAESLLVGGDRDAAAFELIAAADGYAARELLDAALESAGQALRVAPDLPAVHLALARLYFRRGWRERAAETLLLLDRFLEIEGDVEARRATAALARQHLAADPRLERLAGDGEHGRG